VVAELLDIDQFLKNISEEELYKTFLNDPNSISLETTSVLPILSPVNINLPETIPTHQTPILLKPKIEPGTTQINKKVKIEEDIKPIYKEGERYHKRLVANKRSAQASRERKKQMKTELEGKVVSLTKENAELQIAITAMHTENKVLKEEFIQLQNMITESTSSITKLGASSTTPLQYDSSNEEIKKSKITSNSSSPFATAIYLMIFLNSFGQYFNKMSAYENSNLLSTNNNAVSVA